MMNSKDVNFCCSKCGKLLFVMEYSFKPELRTNGEIMLHPIINFIQKEVDISYMSVTDEVKFSPCSSCEEGYHNMTSEAVAEEIETPIEVSLKETMKDVVKLLEEAEGWDDMLGDTLRELHNSIFSLEKSGRWTERITWRIKERLQKTHEEIMKEIEGFKDR